MVGKILLITMLIITVAFNVYAQRNMGETLGRGFANVATCWLELPTEIFLVSKSHDPLTGVIYGPVKGAMYSVLRLLSGCNDILTFPLVREPLIEPDFVFEYWR